MNNGCAPVIGHVRYYPVHKDWVITLSFCAPNSRKQIHHHLFLPFILLCVLWNHFIGVIAIFSAHLGDRTIRIRKTNDSIRREEHLMRFTLKRKSYPEHKLVIRAALRHNKLRLLITISSPNEEDSGYPWIICAGFCGLFINSRSGTS